MRGSCWYLVSFKKPLMNTLKNMSPVWKSNGIFFLKMSCVFFRQLLKADSILYFRVIVLIIK